MHALNVIKATLITSLLVLACSLPLALADTIFSINNPHVEKVGNGYLLNADIQYPLTPRVIEALENGVPITFYQDYEIYESLSIIGDYLEWNTAVWQTKLRYELRYHALVDKYILIFLDTHERQSFQSLDAALRQLGRVRDFNLPAEHTQNINNLKLRLKSGLDLNALPTPMRPGALISSKWQLDTPWVHATWK